MERHLNLIKTGFQQVEKRVFPRFPFTYLTFKTPTHLDNRVYEVKEISHTGMQLCLKDGGHQFIPGGKIHGLLQWCSANLEINGEVKWALGPRLGVAFSRTQPDLEKIKEFLSISNILASMRPLHQSDINLEMPSNLKYWLRADGPVELFIWQHRDGDISHFQIILMENFVEWEDGRGIKTGRVLTKRDVDTPLLSADEFVFQIDQNGDKSKIDLAQNLTSQLPANFLPPEMIGFVLMKLGMHEDTEDR